MLFIFKLMLSDTWIQGLGPPGLLVVSNVVAMILFKCSLDNFEMSEMLCKTQSVITAFVKCCG